MTIPRPRPRLEVLEGRAVPTTISEVEPNDTQAAAQVVPIATGDVLTTAPADWLTIAGAVATNGDWDYYRFTLATAAGVFFDIDSRDTGLSATLDAHLHLYSSAGAELANNDDGYDFEGFAVPPTSTAGGTSRDPSLYADLAAGTYAVRVRSFNGASSGAYHLRLLADPGYAASVPVFHSHPGTADTLYLDFDGHAATDAWGTYAVPAYDLNANPAQFSPAERLAVFNAWRVTAEDYAPFNIDVTTAAPGTVANGVGHRHVITNSDGAELGESGVLGISFLNSYVGGSAADNVSFTFVGAFDPFGGGSVSGRVMATAVEIGNTNAHEFGHALGLNHYQSGSGGGTGSVIPAAIMSTPDLGLNREVWAAGVNTAGAAQDDMAVISRPMNTFGYRADDHGNDPATATDLAPLGGTYAAAGRVERTTDADVFRFTGSGSTTVTVDVDEYVNDLDAVLRLYDSTGAQVALEDPAGSFDATITRTLGPGTYYADVRGTGAAGVAGAYRLRITTTPLAPPTVSGVEAAPLAYAEDQTLAVTDTLVVSDPDTPTLAGATVTISGNFAAGQDELVFADQNGITGTYGAGSLTLSGTASVADYQAALRSVRYRNTSDSPSTATRTVTFRVTDPTGLTSDPRSRAVAVTAVNDAPVLDAGGAMSLGPVAEDDPASPGALVADLIASAGGDRITDPDGPAPEGIAVIATDTANGAWQFSMDNGGAWSPLGAVSGTSARLLAADSQTRVRFIPSADFFGTLATALTFRAWDRTAGTNGGTADPSTNGGTTAFSTATETAALTLMPVNDPPDFTRGANQAVNEDAGAQTVAGWATAISPGPANESGQAVTFLVTTNNDALFAVLPAVSPTGTLTYTPAPNANGSAAVTVRLRDNGGTAIGGVDTSPAQTFAITVNPVNDAPAFTKGADQAVDENAGPQAAPGWATAIRAGPADEAGQVLTFEVATDNDGLFAARPAIGPTGTLTYTPAANASGSATLTVRLRDDGGTAGGGVDVSPDETFTITVNDANNPPVTADDTAATTDREPVTVDVLANDTDPDGDALTLVSVTGATRGTATVDGNQVRYVPRANAHGADVLTYTARDPSGATTTGTLTVQVRDETRPTVREVRLYYGPNRYELLTDRVAILGWSNVRRIQVVFSENVSVRQGDLSLTGLAGDYAFSPVAYNTGTFTATWTLGAPIGIDRLRLTRSGVADATAGNLLGADVVRQFAVLPGDLNGDGLVTLAEANTVRRNIGRRYPTPKTADVNGDGLVTRADYLLARANVGKRV